MDCNSLQALPVLSVRQPWASFVVAGIKSVELRRWRTDYRGWLWIHTGQQPDLAALDAFGMAASGFKTGGLLGIGKLASCTLIESASQWNSMRNEHRSPGPFNEGVFAWQFADVVALGDPIPCRGELKLFRLDEPSRERVRDLLCNSPTQHEFLDAALHLT